MPSSNTSDNIGTPGLGELDPDFDDGFGEHDVSSVEFTVFLEQATTFTGEYVFASDEYLEFIGQGVNDAALVLVNGTNVALAADNSEVSINTINDFNNASQYVDNRPSNPSFNLEPDGFTVKLTFTANLVAGENTFKFGIADRGDSFWDSWFFYNAGSFEIDGVTNVARDTDSDGIADFVDLDSDNDGISDLYESGVSSTIVAADINQDGTISLSESADTNGNGLLDIFEDQFGIGVGTIPTDSDNDGTADFIDLDSDNDTIADTIEARLTVGFTSNDGYVEDDDTDGDGIIDQFDTQPAFGGTHTNLNTPVDTDMDGTPDYLDLDSDNDSHFDVDEAGAITTVASYSDPNGSVNVPINDLQNLDSDNSEADFRSLNDKDGDGVSDIFDIDDDNDGILDIVENDASGYTMFDENIVNRFVYRQDFEGLYRGTAPLQNDGNEGFTTDLFHWTSPNSDGTTPIAPYAGEYYVGSDGETEFATTTDGTSPVTLPDGFFEPSGDFFNC